MVLILKLLKILDWPGLKMQDLPAWEENLVCISLQTNKLAGGHNKICSSCPVDEGLRNADTDRKSTSLDHRRLTVLNLSD